MIYFRHQYLYSLQKRRTFSEKTFAISIIYNLIKWNIFGKKISWVTVEFEIPEKFHRRNFYEFCKTA